MRIQKTLNEISEMFRTQSGRNITLTQTAPDQIRADYLIKIDLALTGHSDDTLMFRYTLGWGANLLAKGAAGVFGSIKTQKLSLDTERQTVQIHLNAFGEFKGILKTHKIIAASINNGVLTADLTEK